MNNSSIGVRYDQLSNKSMLIALCNDHGLAVVATRFTRETWHAQVFDGERYVWVDDLEDIEWLKVDMITAPIEDRYSAQAEVAA